MSLLIFDKLSAAGGDPATEVCAEGARSGSRRASQGHGGEGAVGKFGRETELCSTVLCERPGSDQETGHGAVGARRGRIGGE